MQKLEGEEGEGWSCLRCGETVKQCKPWSGDVLEETQRPSSSGKNVEFVAPEGHESDTAGSDSATTIDVSDSMHESNEWATLGRDETDDTSVHSDQDYAK